MDEKDGLVGCCWWWWLLVAGRLDSEDSNAPKRVGCVEKPTRVERLMSVCSGCQPQPRGRQVARYPSTEVPEEDTV